MEKKMVQSLEWLEAQKIGISIDLFAAAKQHLHFLKIVDKNQWLFDGPILERAIYRYNSYWLPLLAKYSESSTVCEGPLVPLLDCEWIWHCHRLNPVRYISDCEQLYGKVLDNYDIVSSTNGSFKSKTENIWKRLYPMESYDINLDKAISEPMDISNLEKCTTYDLISASKRQSSFYSKVLRAHVDNEITIQEAIDRYKAFLYLIKRSREMSMDIIGVPTNDIDLICHTHQLNPSSYYTDMEKIFGNILQHDDDVDNIERKSDKKLDNMFSETNAIWEETFGKKYWKASPDMSTIVTTKKCVENARCFAVAAEKKSDGYTVVETEKKSVGEVARCFVVAAEKKSDGYIVVETEKKCGEVARCFVVAAEKKSDGYIVVESKTNSVGCTV
ncbi:unnamed protein product, partial [Cochlearia groenlandica]